jgi:SsrA-binding protein
MKGKDAEIANNKRALHEYTILESIEVGVELKGTEVKSVRNGKINLRDAFARVENGQCLLYNCDIQPYEKASWSQHEPRRIRRLLLHKKEIQHLFGVSQVKGNAIVALRAYWKGSRMKLELGVGKGKVASDKREDLKKKESQREIAREINRFNRK